MLMRLTSPSPIWYKGLRHGPPCRQDRLEERTLRRAQGLYIISVAAQILDMHPQTLRKYERAGFVEPPRMGVLRLYSQEDIARLRLIKYFVEDLGLNLAGVELALGLMTRLLALRSRLTSQEDETVGKAEILPGIDELLLELGLKINDQGAPPPEMGDPALPSEDPPGRVPVDLTRLTWSRPRQGHPSR